MTSLRRAVILLVFAGGCRGERPARVDSARVDRLVDSLVPSVEQAVGLRFKTPPRSELVTREQVREYLLAKVRKEFPPERLEGIQSAYQLLRLIPDSLDLKALLLELYSEQVAGYYDPDSTLLYAVQGGDPAQLRLVMAHELVHALQHQYLPLDSIMLQQGNGDRLAAAQAVLEGQATIASIRLLAGGADILSTGEFWDTYRDQIREQQQTMPVFRKAPLILREGLIFPYLGGAAFMQWWSANRPEPLPIGVMLPQSTEQVLHPDRYGTDLPITVAFADSSDHVLFEDTLGELETAILLAVLRDADQAALDLPLGWGGDRYRVYRSADGPALVWYTVWDGAPQADRFLKQAEAGLVPRARDGYRITVAAVTVAGRAGVRVVHAPAAWAGWAALPQVH